MKIFDKDDGVLVLVSPINQMNSYRPMITQAKKFIVQGGTLEEVSFLIANSFKKAKYGESRHQILVKGRGVSGHRERGNKFSIQVDERDINEIISKLKKIVAQQDMNEDETTDFFTRLKAYKRRYRDTWEQKITKQTAEVE